MHVILTKDKMIRGKKYHTCPQNNQKNGINININY